MDGAEVCVRLGCLPALLVLTAVDLCVRRHILAEVESLSWVDLTAYAQLEVLVRNDSIFIGIEFIKKSSELIVV